MKHGHEYEDRSDPWLSQENRATLFCLKSLPGRSEDHFMMVFMHIHGEGERSKPGVPGCSWIVVARDCCPRASGLQEGERVA